MKRKWKAFAGLASFAMLLGAAVGVGLQKEGFRAAEATAEDASTYIKVFYTVNSYWAVDNLNTCVYMDGVSNDNWTSKSTFGELNVSSNNKYNWVQIYGSDTNYYYQEVRAYNSSSQNMGNSNAGSMYFKRLKGDNNSEYWCEVGPVALSGNAIKITGQSAGDWGSLGSIYKIHCYTSSDADWASGTGYSIAQSYLCDSETAFSAPESLGTNPLGYRLSGWKVGSVSGSAYASAAPTADVELYAVYTAVPTYTVTFYSDDKTTVIDTVQVNEGEAAACSVSPTKAQDGGKVFTFDSWEDDNGNPADLTNITAATSFYAKFNTTYAAGIYIVGKGNDWTVENGVYVGSNSTAEVNAEITLAYGDEIKLPYYDGSDFQYTASWDSYSALTTGAEAYYCFGSGAGEEGKKNIKCYAAGTYRFYVAAYTGPDYGDGKHLSVAHVGDLTAQHLAAKLMSFEEYEGHCGDNDRFPAMKAIYLGLSDGEKTKFQGYVSSGEVQFHNAYLRYTDWAKALSKDPWVADPVPSGLASIIGTTTESNFTFMIAIITGIVALGAIGFVVYRKKRS